MKLGEHSPLGIVQIDEKRKKVTIQGPHGTKVSSMKQPMEIGLAVLEVMADQKLAPPTSYRKED